MPRQCCTHTHTHALMIFGPRDCFTASLLNGTACVSPKLFIPDFDWYSCNATVAVYVAVFCKPVNNLDGIYRAKHVLMLYAPFMESGGGNRTRPCWLRSLLVQFIRLADPLIGHRESSLFHVKSVFPLPTPKNRRKPSWHLMISRLGWGCPERRASISSAKSAIHKWDLHMSNDVDEAFKIQEKLLRYQRWFFSRARVRPGQYTQTKYHDRKKSKTVGKAHRCTEVVGFLFLPHSWR